MRALATLTLLAVSIPPALAADQPIPERRVFVDLQGFEVDTDFGWGRYYPSGLREWPVRRVVNRLVEAGWTVVDRDRGYQAALEEQRRPGLDPATRPKSNKLLGANAVVEMTMKISLNRFLGELEAVGIKVGDVVKAKAEINGQIVDTTTGVIRPVAISAASKIGPHRALFPKVVAKGRLEFIEGLDRTLVGEAVDKAADRLVEALDQQFGPRPKRRATPPIFLHAEPGSDIKEGQVFGVWQEGELIAKIKAVSSGEIVPAKIIWPEKELPDLRQEGLQVRPIEQGPPPSGEEPIILDVER